MSGHVCLHRDAFEHPLLKDGERFRAWFWMVSKACWKASKFDVGGRIITLERGQFSCSVRELAEAWGWSKSAVDRFVQRLIDEEMVISTRSKTGTGSGTHSGTSRSIITICNYDKYQAQPKEAGTTNGTHTGTKLGQSWDIKEEGNNTSPYGEGVPPTDTVALIWQIGVALLVASGHDERASRSIVGRWRKEHTDARVLEALLDCQARRISDPVGWMPRRLAASARQHPASGDLEALIAQSGQHRRQAA